jgi:hypothetical protein
MTAQNIASICGLSYRVVCQYATMHQERGWGGDWQLNLSLTIIEDGYEGLFSTLREWKEGVWKNDRLLYRSIYGRKRLRRRRS